MLFPPQIAFVVLDDAGSGKDSSPLCFNKGKAEPDEETISMATVQEFRCEVCGDVTNNPTHWFIIHCGDAALTINRWDAQAANQPGARHYCGEAHAGVYISRWFESMCTPPKPTFK